MYWWHMHGLFGIWIFMFMILFWVLVVVGIVLLVRLATKPTDVVSGRESPIDIIKRRYANGEITQDQYLSMLNDLQTKET